MKNVLLVFLSFLWINTISGQSVVGQNLQEPNPSQLEESFGKVVKMSDQGNYAIITNPSATNDSSGAETGTLSVYQVEENTLTYLSSIMPAGEDIVSFGSSADINGDGTRIVVGAPGINSNTGRVFVYERSGSSWNLQDSIDGANLGDLFGYSVAISDDGNLVVVGVPGISKVFTYELSDGGTWEIYQEISRTSWTEIGTGVIDPPIPDDGDLGTSVDIVSSKAGSWWGIDEFLYTFINDQYNPYIISIGSSSSNFVSLVGITYPNFALRYIGHVTEPSGRIGNVVNLNGDFENPHLAVGDPQSNTVNVYNLGTSLEDSSWWRRVVRFEGLANDDFGSSVSLSSDLGSIVVGAPGGNSGDGYVNIYRNVSGKWDESALNGVLAGENGRGGNFGASVAVNGNGTHALIGEPNFGQGSTFYTTTKNQFIGFDDSWGTPENWSAGWVPNQNNVIDNVIPSNVSLVSTEAVDVYSLTIDSGASLTTNNEMVSSTNPIKMYSGSSLFKIRGFPIVEYNQYVDTDNWYLISPPVMSIDSLYELVPGASIQDFIDNNSLATGSNNNIGLASYVTASGAGLSADIWEYFQSDEDYSLEFFPMLEGYALKLSEPGYMKFLGTYNNLNSLAAQFLFDEGWELLGNAFPTHLSSRDILNADDPDNPQAIQELTIWLWDQSTNSYRAYNNVSEEILVAPCQGFFVKAIGLDIDGNGEHHPLVLRKDWQRHSNTATFRRPTNNQQKINLTMSSTGISRQTDIYYVNGTTTGFDNGYDSTIFGGGDNSFAVYTHLVSNSEGSDFAIQSLPSDNYENMIIPVGVNASSGMSIEISASNANLPIGINVYLEDRDKGVFTLLSESNTSYQITLDSDESGIGRFYLHTTSATLSSGSTPELLEQVSIYTIDNHSNIRLTGLKVGEHAEVTIYDVLGKQIHKERLIGNGVNDVERLPKVQTGIYIIRLSTDRGTMSAKTLLR